MGGEGKVDVITEEDGAERHRRRGRDEGNKRLDTCSIVAHIIGTVRALKGGDAVGGGGGSDERVDRVHQWAYLSCLPAGRPVSGECWVNRQRG